MKVKDCILIEPYTCKEDDNLVEVAQKLRKTTLRHIFVVNADSMPVGIMSVLDMNNRVVAEGKDPAKLKAKDVMSSPVDKVDFLADCQEIAKHMLEKNRVMNPVVKDGKMIGIITISELAKRVKNE